MSHYTLGFDRDSYWEINVSAGFESEMCEFSEDPEDMAAEIAHLRHHYARLEAEIECEERRFNELTDDFAALAKVNDRYEAALVKLRDCDWVITPHDRMDAVREIARKALEGETACALYVDQN